jgi:hypothetical protein
MLQAFISEPYYTNILRDRKMSTIQMIGNAGGLVGKCLPFQKIGNAGGLVGKCLPFQMIGNVRGLVGKSLLRAVFVTQRFHLLLNKKMASSSPLLSNEPDTGLVSWFFFMTTLSTGFLCICVKSSFVYLKSNNTE